MVLTCFDMFSLDLDIYIYIYISNIIYIYIYSIILLDCQKTSQGQGDAIPQTHFEFVQIGYRVAYFHFPECVARVPVSLWGCGS